jgi:mono/diheme cytochrome c family protein
MTGHRIYAVAAVLAVLVIGAAVAWKITTRPHLPPAEKGRRLAADLGCFGCHGPEGHKGAPNPGRTDGTVPGFGGVVMMYARGPEEIREWIANGVTDSKAESESWKKARDAGALVMPAFGERLSDREIDHLVAFVMAATGWPEPRDPDVVRGLRRAGELGCTGCHGPGGRLARPNASSLKGYIPSWDGADFSDLVRDRAEFGEWVEHGVNRRLERNPVARWFLNRAVLRMPAYERHLKPGDVDALWAYVQWLRSDAAKLPGYAKAGE